MAKSKAGTQEAARHKTRTAASSRSLGDQLRQAIKDSGLSVYAVAKGSGLSQPATLRFVNQERDLYLSSADRLAKFFGMELTKPRLP